MTIAILGPFFAFFIAFVPLRGRQERRRCARFTAFRRENILTRAADAAGVQDIDFEPEEFNREYRVASDDPRFARALVDARMCGGRVPAGVNRLTASPAVGLTHRS